MKNMDIQELHVNGKSVSIPKYYQRVDSMPDDPEGSLWDIVERCISLNADDRYSASELLEALEELRGEIHAEETNG